MKQIHKYTSDEKIQCLGYGEWVEEPDEVYFRLEVIECKCLRMLKLDLSGHAYGGHLCGYIKVPEGHVWHGKEFEIDCDVHGGITYGAQQEDGWWIGFDCAHLYDLIPSVEHIYNTREEFKNLQQEHLNISKRSNIFTIQNTYRNVNYVIEQTKNLAKQCIELHTIW